MRSSFQSIGWTMPGRDFAGSARGNRHVPRTARRHRDERYRNKRRDNAFHPGSFGAGVALGIAFTLAGALLPQWWRAGSVQTAVPEPPPGDSAPATRFEFFERLPNDRVATQTASAPAQTSPPPPTGKGDFLLQAGSFTNAADAERLSTTLRSQGLHTDTATVTLSNGLIRHRVIVGPFASSTETQRALTRLREQDIEALVLARPAAG
jgi:SPOR domain